MANTKVTGDLIASGTITAANLVSGTLDGILGTYLSTNSYATESYVTTAVSNLIDAAPASLDTLNELAAALNDDANFATTVTDSIATKLPLAGGTLTGSLDINTSDALRFRFLNSGTFKAGVEVATTAGDMIASSVIDDLAIRSQTNMLFSTGGNTEHMRITSTGNVGIGTASPEAKLDVNGDVFINSNYTGSNAAANDLTIGKITTGDHGITIATGSTYTGSIYFGDSGNNDAGIIGYQHSNNSMKFTTNRSEKMRIDSAGNVGIGTASPASFTWSRFLHIEGIYAGLVYNSTAGGSPFKFSTGVDDNVYIFRDETNSATRMAIDSIGNVGIGTSSPGSKLEISSTSDALLELNGGTTTNPYMLFAQNGTRRAFIQYVNGGLLSLASEYGDIRFMTGAGGTETEKMRIDSSGNVGIGTTAPGEKLSVSGNIESLDTFILNYGNNGIKWQQLFDGGNNWNLRYYNGTAWSSSAITVKTNNNVGIGTTAPDAKLHIALNGGSAQLTLERTGSSAGKAVLAGAANGLIVYDDAFGAKMYVGTSGSYNGLVGIGTTTPSEKLEVAGNAILDATNANLKIKAGITGTKGDIQWTFNTDSTVYASVGLEYNNRSTDGFLIDSGYPITLDAASGYIRFSNNGSERMRIDSSGTLLLNGGIVTVSTSVENGTAQFKTLNANTAPPSEQFYVGNNLGDVDLGNKRGALKFFTGTTERMRVTSSGNVGIGGAPDTLFHVNGGSTFPIVKINASALTSRSLFLGMDDAVSHFINAQGSGSNLLLKTGSVERMRITSGGEVLLAGLTDNTPNGEPATGQLVSYSDGSKYAILVAANSTSGRSMIAFSNPNGIVGEIVSSGSSTAYNTSSDYRLKENVVPMEGALDRVDALKPSRFNFIADADKTVDGFIAHEVQAIVPEAVTGEKDAVDADGNPIYQGIDQSKLVPLLVGAIQELKNIVDQQQIEIETLKAQING
jgi:hypothetical protein